MASLRELKNSSLYTPKGIRRLKRSGAALSLALAGSSCITGTEAARQDETQKGDAAVPEWERRLPDGTADAAALNPTGNLPQEPSFSHEPETVNPIPANDPPPSDAPLPPRDGIDCTPPGQYQTPIQEIANALAQLLGQGVPDKELQAAVDNGQLSTPEQLKRQIERLLMSSQTLKHLEGFAEWWLDGPTEDASRLERFERDLRLTEKQAQEVLTAIHNETRLFMRSLLKSSNSTLKDFLTSRDAYISPSTAALYGVQLEKGGTVAVTLPPERAGGLLTQLGFLTDSHGTDASFIGRGYFLQSRLVCELAPPPHVDDIEGPETPLPWREWWENFYGAPSCSGCHDQGPALGYGFDSFDTLGRTRTQMRGMPSGNEELHPVDPRVKLNIPGLPLKTYPGAPEALQDLAASERVSECFTKYWLAYLMGKPAGAAHSLFQDYRLNKPLCQACADSGSLIAAVVDQAACSRLRGESYLADIIVSLVSSPLMLDHAFPCGAELCISSHELCLEVEDAESTTTDLSCVSREQEGELSRDSTCRRGSSREGSTHYTCLR